MFAPLSALAGVVLLALCRRATHLAAERAADGARVGYVGPRSSRATLLFIQRLAATADGGT